MTQIIKPVRKALGGIHPAYHKELARDAAISELPVSKALRVSMAQHLGAPAKANVKKGDVVLRGQKIGDAAGFISSPVHSPTSGKVVDVAEDITASGTRAQAVLIEPDGQDQWSPSLPPALNWETIDGPALITRVAESGIAGMGGAGFPTHVKLSPPKDKTIDILIINGAECEPFLTADFRLMVEEAGRVWTGCQIIRRILNAKTIRVAIEDNKPEAIAAMEKAMAGAGGDTAIVVLPTSYPQGAEKQQIFAITGREVPSGGLPMDVSTVVENVGTAAAVCDAVLRGCPLVERVTTVTGTPVVQPGNLRSRLGTPFADLVAACGGTRGAVAKIVAGGPMMGLAQFGMEVCTTKTTSGLLLLPPNDVSVFESAPCISCGRCVEACPMRLMPCDLSQMLEAEDYLGAESMNVLDCIECGCCAYCCPSRRPLVQHMRSGKARAMLRRKQQQQKAEKKA